MRQTLAPALPTASRQPNFGTLARNLFIAVVLAFPNGLAGLWRDYVQPRIDRLLGRKSTKSGWNGGSVADGAPAE